MTLCDVAGEPFLPAVAHVAKCYGAQIGFWFLFYSIVGGGVVGSTHIAIHFIN